MSLFDLPQAPFALGDVSKWTYQRIESSSGFNVSNPAGTSHLFRIQPSGTRWWVPSRSYFRIRFTTLTPSGGDVTNAVLPAMGFCANFVHTIEARIGGTVVSQINTMLPQIDAIHTRSTRSGTWLDNAGKVANNWTSDTPKSLTTTEKNADALRYRREYIWTPPLGLFQIPHALPGMQCDLSLVINPRFQTDCVQSSSDDGVAVDTSAYKITVTDFSFHACMVESNRGDNERFVLNISDWQAQALPLTNTLSSQLSQFDVNPATNLLAVALQDSRQSDNSSCRSRFVVLADNNKIDTEDIKALTRLQLEYDGSFFPERYSDPLAAPTLTEQDTQVWLETQMATGQYYSSAGSESRAAFYERGRVFVYQTPRDGKSTATRVLVHTTLGNTVDIHTLVTSVDPETKVATTTEVITPGALKNVNVILFSRAPKAFLVRIADSRVVQVEGTLNANR